MILIIYLNQTNKSMGKMNKKLIKLIKDKNLEYMEPCEPDCDLVRHARHEGSWKHYRKMEDYLDSLLNTESDE